MAILWARLRARLADLGAWGRLEARLRPATRAALPVGTLVALVFLETAGRRWYP